MSVDDKLKQLDDGNLRALAHQIEKKKTIIV